MTSTTLSGAIVPDAGVATARRSALLHLLCHRPGLVVLMLLALAAAAAARTVGEVVLAAFVVLACATRVWCTVRGGLPGKRPT
jgi:hypothetical protein